MTEQQPIQIVRRKVKYPRIVLKTEGLVLIMPYRGGYDANLLMEKHKKWIKNKLRFIGKIKKEFSNTKLFERTEREFVDLVNGSVKNAANVLQVSPLRINLKYVKSKWGSCDRRGKVVLNVLLKYLPLDLINYVVYHEMCHLVFLNHSKNFWQLVAKRFCDYKSCEKKLFGYWFLMNKQGFINK